MTKQDALDGMQKAKDDRIFRHKEVIRTYGQMRGLTIKEYNSIQVKVKGSGSKGKGYASTRLWEFKDLEPVYKMKFDW